MIKKEDVLTLLDGVVHPESGEGLCAGGFVADVSVAEGAIDVVLGFRRRRDPFAASLRKQVSGILSDAFPGAGVSVGIAPADPDPPGAEASRRLPGVKHIIAVMSGKGGVGKSTVAAHTAMHLAAKGHKVGILDADIHGPSQPTLFGVENYLPAVRSVGGAELVVPAESMGVSIMSIGFFITPEDALVWRGPMATGALKQLIRQTAWGPLDYLLVDMPPGTGDVHLSIVKELELDGAVIVSTPQSLALADVRRGVKMLRTEGIDVPIIGIVENMAWFTPAELPDSRYFIFGEGGASGFAAEAGIEFLGHVPVVLPEEENGGRVLPMPMVDSGSSPYYEAIAARIAGKLDGDGNKL